MSEQRSLYRMPEKEAAVLRTLAKVGSNDQLPQALVDIYWGLKNVFNKINIHSIPEPFLGLIAYTAGIGLEPPPPPTLMQMWQAGDLKRHDEVEYKYRDAWGKFGKLIDIDYARRSFAIQGTDGIRYQIPQADIRLPEAQPAAAAE